MQQAIADEAFCIRGEHVDPNNGGYSRTCVGHAAWELTHRLRWEAQHGPIPEGMHLHHLCGNHACINVTHLELLTPLEHKRRHWNCDHDERYLSSQGHWRCRECDRIRQRRYEQRRREGVVSHHA